MAFMLVILLSVAGVAPMATGGFAGFLDGYIASGDTLAQSDIESYPPADDPPDPNLVVNGEDPWVSRVFEVEGVKPGDSGGATLKLQNVGDDGTLQLQFLNLVDEPLTTPEPEPAPDSGELSQKLDMLLWFDDGDNLYETGEVIIAEDTLKNIADITYDLGTLNFMEMKYLGIAWSVDGAVGNEVVWDKCTFDIQFVLH